MRQFLWLAVFGALTLAGLQPQAVEAQTSQQAPTQIPKDDPDMKAAIEAARRTLPIFWAKFINPGPDEIDFALKVGLRSEGRTEYFWLLDIEKRGDIIYGTIPKVPETAGSPRQGERIGFNEGEVADWIYWRKGKFIGYQTLDPLLKWMPKEKADYWRSLKEEP